MSTQLIGFSIGGIARRFLVLPHSMSNVQPSQNVGPQLSVYLVWPNTLVYCALFNTLHSQTYGGVGTHQGITRERFFAFTLVAATAWCECI